MFPGDRDSRRRIVRLGALSTGDLQPQECLDVQPPYGSGASRAGGGGGLSDANLARAVVSSAVVSQPKTLPGTASIGSVRTLLSNDHVHMALLVDDGRLVTAIERDDLPTDVPDDVPAREYGTITGRTIRPQELVGVALRLMQESGRRRMVVVHRDGTLGGLLCLKRSGNGFCTDGDVLDRKRAVCRPVIPDSS